MDVCLHNVPEAVFQPRNGLFVNARGEPLSRVGFWKILKAQGRRAAVMASDLR
jgi:site-specific recombinase XerD